MICLCDVNSWNVWRLGCMLTGARMWIYNIWIAERTEIFWGLPSILANYISRYPQDFFSTNASLAQKVIGNNIWVQEWHFLKFWKIPSNIFEIRVPSKYIASNFIRKYLNGHSVFLKFLGLIIAKLWRSRHPILLASSHTDTHPGHHKF